MEYLISEYDLSSNSNSPFCAGADILNLFFLYDFYMFFMYIR